MYAKRISSGSMVDSQAYLSTLRSLVEEGHDVSMLVTGSSMSPFLIHCRDTIYFGKPDRGLKKGDMVFYQRENGDFVMHRICKIDKTGLYLLGDAQTIIEGPIGRNQIFALVKKVRRKGKWLEPDDMVWKLFSIIWLRLIPLRPFLIKMIRLS